MIYQLLPYRCNPILLLFHLRMWWGSCHMGCSPFYLVRVEMYQVDIQHRCISPYHNTNHQDSLLNTAKKEEVTISLQTFSISSSLQKPPLVWIGLNKIQFWLWVFIRWFNKKGRSPSEMDQILINDNCRWKKVLFCRSELMLNLARLN